MSSAFFAPARESFARAEINWVEDDIRVMLVRDTYTFDRAHKFLSDLGPADNGRSNSLAGKSAIDGVLDADDSALIATASARSDALVVFRHTGDDTTARLIIYIDSAAAGLPYTPAAGQALTIGWNNGPNKIGKL